MLELHSNELEYTSKKGDVVINAKAGEEGTRERVPRGQEVNNDTGLDPLEIVWGQDMFSTPDHWLTRRAEYP